VVEQTNEALGAIFGIPELGRATHFRASSFAPLAESGLHDTLRDVMEQDRTVYRETDYNLTDEHTITLRYVVTPTHDDAGAVDGAQALVEDFTWIYAANRQIRRSLNEKESLLREIHHRVKNNLQTLASLLRLQSDESHDPAVAEALRDSVARVQTMGMVHERLYASESLARIAFHDYLHDLVGHLISLGFGEGERPEVELEVEALELDINLAIPVGLIANEFVTNALKHGVSRASEPRLSVTARQCDQGLVLRVLDNGPGFSGEAPPVQSGSLGMNLITALANQLHATVTYDSRNGHLAQLVVPLHDGGAPTQPC
jgi:two-component sensor histidine kinase